MLKIVRVKTGSSEESCWIWEKGVACWIVEAIMRALPRCRASEEAADIGIYNKREDSLCGCFVAVAIVLNVNLVLSLVAKKRQNTQT